MELRQRVEDMRDKEVINVNDGTKIGFICDLEIDTKTATATALIIYGKLRLFGLLGREDDMVIPWENVKLIGDDTVLVDYKPIEYGVRKRKSILSSFIEIK